MAIVSFNSLERELMLLTFGNIHDVTSILCMVIIIDVVILAEKGCLQVSEEECHCDPAAGEDDRK